MKDVLTVGELIERLSNLPQEAFVYMHYTGEAYVNPDSNQQYINDVAISENNEVVLRWESWRTDKV